MKEDSDALSGLQAFKIQSKYYFLQDVTKFSFFFDEHSKENNQVLFKDLKTLQAKNIILHSKLSFLLQLFQTKNYIILQHFSTPNAKPFFEYLGKDCLATRLA
jgi:hypothetical protein